jgi:hypothetical protein
MYISGRILVINFGSNRVPHSSSCVASEETLLDGRLIKIYAEELGGNDIVSGNYYPTLKDGMLKPCEMSDEKVIDFVISV